MDLSEFSKLFAQRMEEVDNFLRGDDVKDIMGIEAVNHFKQSFTNEGFTDSTLEKWAEVERRKPGSPWYKKGRAGATRKILSGETKLLAESIKYVYVSGGVRISNYTSYAAVHQFGGSAKIFGKTPFQMKARPFMGKSRVLKENIENIITDEIKNILAK